MDWQATPVLRFVENNGLADGGAHVGSPGFNCLSSLIFSSLATPERGEGEGSRSRALGRSGNRGHQKWEKNVKWVE